ncbi:MAG: hypothetical protein P9L92_12830 [Candidatus Electryonea clarkiae]|nr:hypothetical protein [Candidatus Electryonea clarkiae]MDP8288728.1 hypothetical protein [Candidatus Electryonea clarkiae]
MAEVIEIFMSGMEIPSSPDGIQTSYLILSGEVSLHRKKLQGYGFLTLLKPGDVVFPENIFSSSIDDRSAYAVTDVKAVPLNGGNLVERLRTTPDWLSEWVMERLRVELGIKKRMVAALPGIFSLCSLMYNLMFTFGKTISPGSLKTYARPLMEEIAKILPPPRISLYSFFSALSETGLIDFRKGDSLSESILIPDENLFIAFLVFLQRKAGLPTGLYNGKGKDSKIELSREAGLLIEALFQDKDIGQRFFDPERAVVHLPEEKITELFKIQGLGDDLGLSHSAIDELQQHGAFTLAQDNHVASVFVNLRNLLRINIASDLEENFSDILEYICQAFIELRTNAERSI